MKSMKKLLALFVLAALTIPFAFAQGVPEEQAMLFQLEGTILEVTDEGVRMDMGDSGEVLVNISEDTILEGSEEALAPGQYALVEYDGKMTRSRPAQITAEKISVYALFATVVEVEEDGVLLLTEDGEDVFSTLPEGLSLEVGKQATFYFNGAMTMSLPPRINALKVAVEEAE